MFTKVRQHFSLRSSILVGLLVIGLIIAVLEVTNTAHIFHKEKKPSVEENIPTAAQQTKGEPGSSSTTSQQATSDKASASVATTLITPYGNFVSNHRPNLSGKPAPNGMQSGCTTTVGATCQIIFTKGDVTKSLPAKVTDSSGATYWSWTLQQIGLSTGSWKVQAKASMGNQTQTAADALNLEVAE